MSSERLKQLLLLKNHDGETPTCSRSTRRATRTPRLVAQAAARRHLPAAQDVTRDVLVELGVEADGIWNRPGFKLPEMALLVATDKGNLIDDDGNELVGESEPYVEFLKAAELPTGRADRRQGLPRGV